MLTVTALVALLIALRRALVRARRARTAAPLLALVRQLAVTAAAVYLAFLSLWGFNYRRVPMTERLVIEPGSPEPAAVVGLGLEAVSRLNALHEAAHRSAWLPPERDASLQRAHADVQDLLLGIRRSAVQGRPKHSIYGPYFRWTSVDGMVNPFGLEVLVNPDLLPFERPFVAAHEWAHLAGFADEAEASFVGWLTCLRSNEAAQYSGWLNVYWQVAGEVNGTERAALDGALAAGPRQDLAAIVERIRDGQLPWLRDAGWRVYDQYLKANRVEEGVRSYGAVVTLILRARFDEGWVPVRRTSDGCSPSRFVTRSRDCRCRSRAMSSEVSRPACT